MPTIDYDDAFEEWQAVYRPSLRERVQFRLWAYECSEFGHPAADSVRDPFDSVLIYWHPVLRVLITFALGTDPDGEPVIGVLSIVPA